MQEMDSATSCAEYAAVRTCFKRVGANMRYTSRRHYINKQTHARLPDAMTAIHWLGFDEDVDQVASANKQTSSTKQAAGYVHDVSSASASYTTS
jgi:hypothetical protein